MTPKENYKLFKLLFEKYGNKSNEVHNGSYSIFKKTDGQFEVTFLNKINDEYYHDPHILVAVDDEKEKAFALYYWNNFADAHVRITRNPQTKTELDERLHGLLARFNMCVN